MKKVIAFSMLLMLFMDAKAQRFELKVSPLGAILGKYNINAEYMIGEQFSIDLSPSYAIFGSKGSIFKTSSNQRRTMGIQLAAKYYIFPNTDGDGFSFGPYVSYYSTRFKSQILNPTTGIFSTNIEIAPFQLVIGGLSSRKFLFANNMLLDIGTGAGYIATGARNLGNGFFENPFAKIDITIRLAVGYRFGGQKEDQTTEQYF